MTFRFNASLMFPCVLALPLAAQSGRMPLQDAPAHTVLVDDDDGRVEIVPPAAPATAPARTFHGGSVVKAPRVSTLFLGTAWSARAHAGVMRDLNGALVAFGVSERFAAMKSFSLTAYSFPVAEEGVVPFLPQGPTVTDLALQHFLHAALAQGRLGRPSPESLVVVFLAPGQNLTLGGKAAGEAFLAYHSAYHDEAGLMRYVVVPFGASVTATAHAAEQALAAAILNPDGDGWY
ncbi:hypothetical protein GETHPA_15170 [Geothrix rubra]|uniref:Uncharacterized protein n=1 Tax=Geothrix rubra TaxID=2927977 RepID=A0ABQ5Q5F1_9BACT|nr:hypothetical protein [Geothrix rubra]GLH69984.1 hypothetical protein GETHPA_15170 [Geothrix rubra]